MSLPLRVPDVGLENQLCSIAASRQDAMSGMSHYQVTELFY